MGLFAFAAWMLEHPFLGIQHDSVLYTLFALAKLHPDTLNADVFLRLGSQDKFSLFSPIYAAAMSLFGMEHAAALLLVLSQAALLACAWALARRLMRPLDATLGTALLVLLPNEYGGGITFRYLEDFITARVPAEALVVGAVLAAVTRRYWIAVALVVAALLIHPVMGAAGAAFLLITFLVPRHPKPALAVAGVGFVAAVAIVMAIAPLGRVADVNWWFTIHSTSSYLFITMWTPSDWSRTAVYLVILTLGSLAGATPLLRRICMGMLATLACGALITLVFCDLLHVSLFIDLQAWRWLWLADVLALTLAPAIVQDCWHRGDKGRVAVLALAGAWIFRDLPVDLLLDAAAIACAAAPAKWSQHPYWKLASVGACALLGLAICLDVSTLYDYEPGAMVHGSALLDRVRGLCVDGVLPGVAIIATWILMPRVAPAAALTAVVLCAWLIPFAWASYTIPTYTPELASRFAPWRAAIPDRAEVLWLHKPVATWYLLNRPSYWSDDQVAGAIFSREKALLLQRRTTAVGTALKISRSDSLDLSGMRAVCADPDLKYIVSSSALAPTPLPPVTVDPTEVSGTVYLYRCTDLLS